MFNFLRVSNFAHKKIFFARMSFRASRISLFRACYYLYRPGFALKFVQFCIVAEIENKISLSIFDMH